MPLANDGRDGRRPHDPLRERMQRKADASRRIDELQQRTGRGRPAAAKDEPANPGSAGTSGDEATLSIGPD